MRLEIEDEIENKWDKIKSICHQRKYVRKNEKNVETTKQIERKEIITVCFLLAGDGMAGPWMQLD